MPRLTPPIAIALATIGMVTSAAASPVSSATPPPTIYHVLTTAFCARLHDQVTPAVGLILQTDPIIAKSPPLFNRYASDAFASSDPTKSYDSINVDSPAVSMTLQKMSYLVHPIAQNVIAAQTILGKPSLIAPTGNADDDKLLTAIKEQLLKTVASQSASLDLINGFVQTQQLGEIQHAGTEYISNINNTGMENNPTAATPNPYMQDPNAPGVAQNPYAIDLSTIPGLAVGYNPLKNIVQALDWARDETAKREGESANLLNAAIAECNEKSAPPASPTP